MNGSRSFVSATSASRSPSHSPASSPGAVGFDIHREKVDELRRGINPNGEQPEDVLKATSLKMTSDLGDLKGCTFFVVAVPTPVDANNVPDLTPVERASETVGRAIGKGAVVVFESTVYPGVTEDVCGPILARVSGLRSGHRLQAGVLAGAHQPGRQGAHAGAHHQGGERRGRRGTLERVAAAYGSHRRRRRAPRAQGVKVAEAERLPVSTSRRPRRSPPW